MPEMPEPYFHGYAADAPGAPLRDVTRSNPDVAWAAGAMISTVDDLRVWVDALVAGSLVSPTLQADRLAIEAWQSEPVHVGYGLGIQEIGGLLGYNGGIMGYGSWMMHDPKTGSTIVVVTNLGSTTGGIASVIIFAKIADLLFRDRGFLSLVPTPRATPTP
jgi:D-alanyl-D-alanine carboxypeptidase